MAKHLLDETAEFALPRNGRHASPDTGELDITQRIETVIEGRPARPSASRDEDDQSR